MTFLAKLVDFKSQHKTIQPHHRSILRAATTTVSVASRSSIMAYRKPK